ncbi:MAG: alpha/beta fold hydrolase [Actinomycetota bacterium]|nr:alpha/beta fold hydrolase [Actinomycetota bacterium]
MTIDQGPTSLRARDRSLEELLLDRLRARPSPEAKISAKLSLEVSDGDSWTIGVEPDRLSLSAGVLPNADTTVFVDSRTMSSLLLGERSGIEAFLSGDLRVRGNLALSLRLSSLVGTEQDNTFEKAREVSVDGVRTFYLEAGSGPAVLLLHGLGATNASMLTTFWELARDHRVIAPDLPGFGESAKPVRSYNAAFYARWLDSFMKELRVDRAVLIGNSMGGRVAIETALCSPEKVERIVLLAPSPAFLKKREMVGVVRLLRPELAFLPLPLPRSQAMRGLKGMFSKPSRLEQAWYDAAIDEFLRIFGTPRGRIAFFSAARQIYLEPPHGESGFWERLPSLDRPALFVWGKRDRLVPPGFARHVEKAVPAAKSIVLDDCGHVPQYELPDETHRLVRDFLAQ